MTAALTVEPSTVAAITRSATFGALAKDYAAESQVKGLPAATSDMTAYAQLEAAGLLHAFAATVDGELVGFLALLIGPHPRYRVALATLETLFVSPEHRSSGAGLKLLAMAESKARELGAPGLLASAPVGGALAEVLPRRGYAETNRTFFKGFGHD